MSTYLYYFDDNDPLLPYTHVVERDIPEGCFPPRNVLLIKPRLDEHYIPLVGEWPVANEARDGWNYVKDHRQKYDERGVVIEGTGTPYWLPGDTYGQPARYMETLGSLPKDIKLLPPDKPIETVKRNKINEINNGYVNTISYLLLDGSDITNAPTEAVFMLEEAKQYDADGVALVIERLTEHKRKLLQCVQDASTVSVVESIVVKYQA